MERVFTGRELVNTTSRLEWNAALERRLIVLSLSGYKYRCEYLLCGQLEVERIIEFIYCAWVFTRA